MFSYIYFIFILISFKCHNILYILFCNIFNTYIFILEKKYFIQLYCCFIILGFLTIFFNRRKHYRSASHKLFRKRLACQHNIFSTLPHNIIKTTRLQSKLLHIHAASSFYHIIRRNTSLTARLGLSSLNKLKQITFGR